MDSGLDWQKNPRFRSLFLAEINLSLKIPGDTALYNNFLSYFEPSQKWLVLISYMLKSKVK